ncbi:MAG TPA: DNA repair protein RecO [Chryseosolibacter sp.]|nr:DNA repair protein RecO [Chryseosolibacter sp.]
MIQKVRGIVLRFTKYGETSIIVTIFTDAFGLQSYIVNGVRSKSGKNKIALYQPLTLLNLVVYHREHANLERIKEITTMHPYSSLQSDIRKSSIGLFIAELLNKTIRDESEGGELFEFVCTSLITLDTLREGFENFHLIFMLKFSRYLGFGAMNINEVVGPHVADEPVVQALESMLTCNYTDRIAITNHSRRILLDLITGFYKTHIENFGEMKSAHVLREIFS